MSTISTQERVAEALLKVKAVKLQPEAPFTWASGWKSPIYCDNRVTLSYPDVRTLIKTELAEAIRREFDTPDVIAGVATGAIAQGHWWLTCLVFPSSTSVPWLRIMVWVTRSRESSLQGVVSSS